MKDLIMTNLSLQLCKNMYTREYQTEREADKLRTHVLQLHVKE